MLNQESKINAIVNKLYDEVPVDVLSDLDESYVINNEDRLNKEYHDLYESKGFTDFYSMYIFGKADFVSSDGKSHKVGEDVAQKSTSKNKDTSKLQLVQRTVMRKGKPTQLSFYQDPDKKDSTAGSTSTPKASSNAPDNENSQGVFTGGPKYGKPLLENIAKAEPPVYFYTKGRYSSGLYDYIFYVSGNISGVMGVSKKNDVLSPKYVAVADKDFFVSQVTEMAKKLVTMAWVNNYGIEVPVGYADKLMDYLGLSKSRGLYKCKNVHKILGDIPWE